MYREYTIDSTLGKFNFCSSSVASSGETGTSFYKKMQQINVIKIIQRIIQKLRRKKMIRTINRSFTSGAPAFIVSSLIFAFAHSAK